MKFKTALIIVGILILGLAVTWWLWGQGQRIFWSPQLPPGPQGINQSNGHEADDVTVVASGLTIPWEIAWLPDGSMLVTERVGNLLKIGADRKVIPIPGVRHIGEGGLQGLAIDPDFVTNRFIYLYLTTSNDGRVVNRVERYVFADDSVTDRHIIIDDIPGAQYHDGGRIAFGPDGKLYITTGDASQANRAQDLDYLGGKILRFNADGSIPTDNPFENSPVYSYGHRNPQGITWDKQGNLWATEHGRSGAASGYDELNMIVAAGNYGWPEYQGAAGRNGIEIPVIHSGPDYTWAPAGVAYGDGSLFFAGLRGEALYEYRPNSEVLLTHFFGDYGRLRAVVIGPDGALYVSTSNRDGRGTPVAEDDRIIRIDLSLFR